MLTLQQRYRGALLGLACGDALGTTLEFRLPGSFEPITDITGGGPFKLQAGQWTDDTSMALCLAESLLEKQAFDAEDQMQRYVKWWQEGHLSSTGQCFDIGQATRTALQEYLTHGDPFAGSTHPMSAGNGSIMRLAPVVMFFFPDNEAALHFAVESSRTTHAAAECLDACRYMAWQLAEIFSGADKQALQNAAYTPETRKLSKIHQGSYLNKQRQELRGSGYVIESLEAAMWCFHQHDNYADAVLAAANLGDDADTTAAVCGQLAGAYYGIDAIPQHWQDKITLHAQITEFADRLLASAGH